MNTRRFFVAMNILIAVALPCAAQTRVQSMDEVKGDSNHVSRHDSVRVVLSPAITVTAGIIDSSKTLLPRTLDVITAQRLTELPARDAVEALQFVPGVDLRQRGPLGVQADVSMRGGTFEQTAILIDGLRINDVQTGHHSAALPMLPWDVARIEVLKGGAARFYGAGALDGAVNFVTDAGATTPVLRASLMGGDARFTEGRLSVQASTGNVHTLVSAQALRHNGWLPSTDVDKQSVFFRSAYNDTSHRISLLAGVNNRAFGANGYYTPTYPMAWEHVVSWFAGATADVRLTNDVRLVARSLYRINSDEFLLNRDNPAFYRNLHRTDQFTTQLGATYTSTFGATSVFVDGGRDEITSTNLGDHQRIRGSVIAEQSIVLKRFMFSVGVGTMLYSDRTPLPVGGADVSWQINDDASDVAFVSVQRSGRVPTYTDLYYRDPRTIGNPLLRPESAITSELGYRHSSPSWTATASVYRRDANDLIDYGLFSDTSVVMRAQNIGSVFVNGLEARFSFALGEVFERLQVGLNWQSVVISSPVRTRYSADNLRFQFLVESSWHLPLDIYATTPIRVFQRVTDQSVRIVQDLRLRRPVGPFTIIAEATNLWNETWVESGWAVMPPRWARFGVEMMLQ